MTVRRRLSVRDVLELPPRPVRELPIIAQDGLDSLACPEDPFSQFATVWRLRTRRPRADADPNGIIADVIASGWDR